MANPTPYAHLYRLGLVLITGLVLFMVIMISQTPASWNYEVWYRGDALIEIRALPIVHGDNASCVECHEDESEEAANYAHKPLNCEGCHGPLTLHVQDGEKIADAVGKSDWQCLNCHEAQISKPSDYPQFPGEISKHENIKKKTLCVKCHDPHDPALSEDDDDDEEDEDVFSF